MYAVEALCLLIKYMKRLLWSNSRHCMGVHIRCHSTCMPPHDIVCCICVVECIGTGKYYLNISLGVPDHVLVWNDCLCMKFSVSLLPKHIMPGYKPRVVQQ